jgi:hypothetical protein
MSMLNLSDVVNDPLLADSFTIQRSTGVFGLGGWTTTPTNIPGYGVVSVASDEDLLEIPEASRVTGAMVFHSQARIYLTQIDEPSGTQHVADIILWNNQQWRILHVAPYNNRGFWRAIGVRMAGI